MTPRAKAKSKLVARIPDPLPLACPARGGGICPIAFNTDAVPIRMIRTHLDEPHESPPLESARRPPTGWAEVARAPDDCDAIEASPHDPASDRQP